MSDLTAAMQIKRPSLYAAFGGKEALFRKVLDHYAEGPSLYLREALAQPTARQAVEQILRGAAGMCCAAQGPRGCLLVQGALACSDEANPIRQELIARRLANESALRKRLHRAKAEGDLPASANSRDLARFITTVSEGIAVQAASGASRSELLRVVRTAMQAWPE